MFRNEVMTGRRVFLATQLATEAALYRDQNRYSASHQFNTWIHHPPNLPRTHHPSPTTCPSKPKKESACVTVTRTPTEPERAIHMNPDPPSLSPFRLYHHSSSHHSACSGTKTSASQPSPFFFFSSLFLAFSSSAFVSCLLSHGEKRKRT